MITLIVPVHDEEAWVGRCLVLLAKPVVTSDRYLRAFVPERSTLPTRLALRGRDAFRDRPGLDLWYRPVR